MEKNTTMNIRLSISAIMLATTCFLGAQKVVMSEAQYFNIQHTILPPVLEVVDGSLKFNDANGNMVINANETSNITMTIRNVGRGTAYGCKAQISAEGTTNGLTYNSQTMPTLQAGQSCDLNFPIFSSMYTANGDVHFTIAVIEPNGFGTDPVQLSVKTHQFDAPFVEIVSYKLSSNASSGKLQKKTPFTMQLLLQNTDQGVAKNVTMEFVIPENMFLLDGNTYMNFATLQPNEKKTITLELQSNAFVPDELNLDIALSESYGKYAKNATIPLHFGQAVSKGMTTLTIAGQEKESTKITRGSLLSDVDENIPETKTNSDKTFALIIANENYQNVEPVQFALNDGNIFRQYCQRTLGLPESNIHYIPNATSGKLISEVNWLENLIEVFHGKIKVIFYYAGHGIPSEDDKSAYLLPIDGNATDLSIAYKLDRLFQTLGQLPADAVTIFMDACFSGSQRGSGMLASARGVALKSKAGVPQGNMVVFSAAQGDETAYPNNEQGHGMFTYYLLKKLQETQGDVTLKDLGDYITTNVSQQSIVLNSKSQTPCVTPSSNVADTWMNWKLK